MLGPPTLLESPKSAYKKKKYFCFLHRLVRKRVLPGQLTGMLSLHSRATHIWNVSLLLPQAATCSKPLYKAARRAAACEHSLTAPGWQSAIQNDNHLSLGAYLWERTEKNVILSILVKKPHDEQNLWGCTPPGPAAGTRHRSRQPSAGEVSALKTKLGRVTTQCHIPKRQERAKLPGKYLFCCLQVWS